MVRFLGLSNSFLAYQSVETNDLCWILQSPQVVNHEMCTHILCHGFSASLRMVGPWSSCCLGVSSWWPPSLLYTTFQFIHHHRSILSAAIVFPRFPLCISVGIPIAACLQATHVLRLVMKSWSNHGKSASWRKVWAWYEHVPKICEHVATVLVYILRLWSKTDWGRVRIYWSGCMS